MIVKMKLVVVLLLLVFLVHEGIGYAVPGIHTMVHSIARRSAEHDAYVARKERQATNQCPWYTYRQQSQCASVNYTKYDFLGRRNSGILTPPQNQGRCGSCWAFASSGTFTDLMNIKAGEQGVIISPEHLTGCYTTYAARFISPETINGCCGGKISLAAAIFKQIGATTTSCLRYTLQNYLIDRQYKLDNPLTCPRTCSNGAPYTLESYRIQSYTIYGKPEAYTSQQINEAIKRGPIMGVMDITEEFGRYACGIFCTSPSETILNRHAVEIVDYGTDTDTGIEFFVVKNSWGTDRGENGYFRIKRGDLGLGSKYLLVELTLRPQGNRKRASSTDMLSNITLPPNSVATCAPYRINNPTADEQIMIVANFAIEELNNRSLVRCPDATNRVGSVALSSVTSVMTQSVAGTFFNITMMVTVRDCGDTPLQSTISADVFQDLDGRFSLAGYMYNFSTSSGVAVKMSILLLLGALGLVFILQ